MCGIVGLISKRTTGFWYSDVNLFKQLLYLDQLRGVDGTGVIYNNKKGGVKIKKAAIPASEFLENPQMKKLEASLFSEASFVIGHNRAATKGKIDVKNTHPFRHKHITLVHNGTLNTHKDLLDVDSDSQALTYHLAEKGLEEAVLDFDGAFALAWADEKEQTINFLRNWQRPFAFVETDDLWIFASEKDMALFAANRMKLKVKDSFETISGKLYSWSLTDRKFNNKQITLHKAKPPTIWRPPYQNFPSASPSHIGNKLPKLGDEVCFIPNAVFGPTNGTYYLEGEFEDDFGNSFECRLYTKEVKHLHDLEKESLLTGNLVQYVTRPADSSQYYTLRDVKKVTLVQDILNKPEKVKCDYCQCLTSFDETVTHYGNTICVACANDQFIYGET